MDELAAAYGFVLRCSCAASVTHTVHAAVAALAALVQRSEVVPGTERQSDRSGCEWANSVCVL